MVGNIQLVQSEQSRVTLSAPENYIDFFEFENENGELEIKYKKDNVSFKSDNITIIIYTPTLKKIKNSGAADIRMDSLTTDELDIENSGVGTFDLAQIKARKVDVKCSGVGNITLSGESAEAELRCSGVGNINAKNLKANEVDANVIALCKRTLAPEPHIGKLRSVGRLDL